MAITHVVAALIWDQGRFLICQRPAHKTRGLLWEFVGGKVEPDESPEAALIRECREELDITVDPRGLFMEVDHEYPDITIRLSLFHAVIKEGTPRLLEHNALAWVTPEEAAGYAFCPADQPILDHLRRCSRTALYWDLDGTLTHSRMVWNIAMAEALCKADPTLPLFSIDAVWEARRNTGFTFCWQDPRDDRSPHGPAFWEVMNERFLRVFADLGIDPETARRAIPYVREHIIDPANYHLYPDTLEVLEACKARGIPCIMISNNYPEAADTVRALGLEPYFRALVISGALGLDKPHADIFQYAMSHCPECNRHVMIGDNISADIGGGKACGMETVYVHRGPGEGADHSFDTLLPILELL